MLWSREFVNGLLLDGQIVGVGARGRPGGRGWLASWLAWMGSCVVISGAGLPLRSRILVADKVGI